MHGLAHHTGAYMKSWELTRCMRGDPAQDEWHATLYEQPAWREVLSPLVYWIDLHVPRWMQPGNGRPASRDNGDGTCTFLWRLRLELFLCYDFHHDKRKVIERVRVQDRDENWKIPGA